MSGRGRLEIGTYGDISTTRTSSGTVRAEACYRDGDGMVRKVTATAATAKQAKQGLRLKLRRRNTATGFGVALSPESSVSELAEAWMEDVQVRSDLAPGTKDLYRRELNSLVLPTFKTFRLREIAAIAEIGGLVKPNSIPLPLRGLDGPARTGCGRSCARSICCRRTRGRLERARHSPPVGPGVLSGKVGVEAGCRSGAASGNGQRPSPAWHASVVGSNRQHAGSLPTTRRRGAVLEEAILTAAWDELAERGWAGFGIEGVSNRCGTAKAVVYRAGGIAPSWCRRCWRGSLRIRSARIDRAVTCARISSDSSATWRAS